MYSLRAFQRCLQILSTSYIPEVWRIYFNTPKSPREGRVLQLHLKMKKLKFHFQKSYFDLLESESLLVSSCTGTVDDNSSVFLPSDVEECFFVATAGIFIFSIKSHILYVTVQCYGECFLYVDIGHINHCIQRTSKSQ